MIFLVVLLFFGAKRLPDLFRSFGKSLKEFKNATSDIEDDIRTAMEEEPEKTKPAPSAAKTEATTDPKPVEASDDSEASAESEASKSESSHSESSHSEASHSQAEPEKSEPDVKEKDNESTKKA